MSEDAELTSWYEALAENPSYYMDTKEGQRELADMIRRESERLIEELGKSVKRTKEIIWLSRFCPNCKYYRDDQRKMQCGRWSVRIVKPFYGRPVWHAEQRPDRDEKEMVLRDIDWSSKWKEISDQIVERAVQLVNGGYPYFCFSSQ
jgi:hypothetical protein